MSDKIKILAIESSCDETAAAVVEDGRCVKSNIISSQIELHKLYGGVVPEIASRKHVEKVNFVVREALKEAGVFYKYVTTVYDKDNSLTNKIKHLLKGKNLKKANTRKCPYKGRGSHTNIRMVGIVSSSYIQVTFSFKIIFPFKHSIIKSFRR